MLMHAYKGDFMELRLIRNATLRLAYAGQMWLTDPFLAAKHSLPSYRESSGLPGGSLSPLVDLPIAPEEVVAGVDVTVLSHLHSDHFDGVAQRTLPSETPILCQPGDEGRITAKGFIDVTPVAHSIRRGAITLTRVDGQHGQGSVLKDMGVVSGFVFQAEGEPTIYWAGDTILYDAVRETIAYYSPDVIITHSCGAIWGDGGLIVMDAAQTATVCEIAPRATVVAIHMDVLDHATVTRTDLRAYADAAGIATGRLLIPEDGATLTF